MSTDRPEAVPAPEPQTRASLRGGSRAAVREQQRRRARGRYRWALWGSAGLLAVVAVLFGVVGLQQGPRLSAVHVDPTEAITHAGSRVILSANQSLGPINPDQVTVEPETAFTVDTGGRTIGVRFTAPLDDQTEYTVTVREVSGIGGGPTADLVTTFTTPAADFFLLQRSVDGDDTIFRSDLSGESAVPVFHHPRINDYRAADGALVAIVEEDETSAVLVIDPATGESAVLPTLGDGYIRSVQVADRGGLIGYSYSDRHLSGGDGRASVLVMQNRDGSDLRVLEVAGEEVSVAEWQFVPDSTSVLFIDFTGTLFVEDLAGNEGPQAVGTATSILGISRGTYTAIVQHVDGSITQKDLSTGIEEPLAAVVPDLGLPQAVIPYPKGTLRHVIARDAQGLPTGQSVVRVDDGGNAIPLVEVAGATAILSACPSPSGRYTAVTVAPELTANPYDDMLLPLPRRLETHIVDTENGAAQVVLSGFDISWCRTAPER